MENKFNTLDDIAIKFKFTYEDEDLEYATEIVEIYNSENPENLNINLDNLIILNWIGLYYEIVKKDEELMYKYYKLGAYKGGIGCMYCLGQHYQTIKEYDEMKKYYMMAIDRENSDAMYSLGRYYKNIENNYEEMEKYYIMAASKGNSNAMYHLGLYYQNINNYEEMKKYYLMGIAKNDSISVECIFNIAVYYQRQARLSFNNKELRKKNYEEMEKYYLMAIDKGNVDAMFDLGVCYSGKCKSKLLALNNIFDLVMVNTEHPINYELMKKYFKLAIENGCLKALDEIKSYYKERNYLEYYDFLMNIENKTKEIIDEIKNIKLQYTQLIYA